MNLLVFSFLFCLPPSDTLTVTVFKVRDGDTIEVVHNGKELVVRLHGIDSPDKCQDQYEEAKAFTKQTLLNKTIKLVPTGTDQYNRIVAEILFDAANTKDEFGVWFNQAIVASGFAWHWPKFSQSPKLVQAQQTAMRFKIGVWKMKNPMPPWEFRRTEAYKQCVTNF